MSETNPITPVVNGEPTPTPTPASYTKEQVDSAAAAARREATEKAAALQTRLDALEAKEKERADAELTELEKAHKERDDAKNLLKEKELTATQYKEKLDLIDAKEKEKVLAAIEGLTDSQKALVEKLPLYDQMTAIGEFKNNTPPSGAGKPNNQSSNPTLAAILAMPIGAERDKAYQKYRDGK